MINIEKAISKEEEYTLFRTKGEEPFHLIDAVKECGFESLREYFAEKRNYQFSNLKFDCAEISAGEAIAEIFRMMDSQETKVLFVTSEEPFVFSGESKPYNEDYCTENNIPVYPLHTKGGAIVSTEGDFSIGICFPDTVGVDVQYILSKLRGIFGKYMENVSVNGNDILLNGEKICGSIMYHQNGMKCFACHFSFKDNTELVEKICNVSGSVKVPTAISGLTVAQFKKELSEWLRL